MSTGEIWNLPPSNKPIKPLGEEPTTPPPDPNKPYVWFDGEWILMETDPPDGEE